MLHFLNLLLTGDKLVSIDSFDPLRVTTVSKSGVYASFCPVPGHSLWVQK